MTVSVVDVVFMSFVVSGVVVGTTVVIVEVLEANEFRQQWRGLSSPLARAMLVACVLAAAIAGAWLVDESR